MFSKIVERIDKQAGRMGRMMERMHVDCVALAQRQHGNAFAAARSNCMACRSTEACDRSHRAYEEGRADAAPPETFCPNARLFAEHAERR